VFLAVQILTLIFSLTLPNIVVFFMSIVKKFNEDSKNVLKTVIFSLQVGFTDNFVSDCSFKLFLAVQILTLIFSLILPNFVVFFYAIR